MDPPLLGWLVLGFAAWWIAAMASAIRRELADIEEGEPREGEDYKVVSLLRRLKDEPVLLALRLRISRSAAVVFFSLSLAGLCSELAASTTALVLFSGWMILAGLETGGGGVLVRRWGRWRGGSSYALWGRITQAPARLVRPLLSIDRENGESEDHALILAETRAASLSGGARLGLEERRFLRRLLASTSLLVVDILTRWELVDRLDADLPIRRALADVHASGHSRLPVMEAGRVVGLVTAKDLLARIHAGADPDLPVKGELRPVYFVRQELTVEALLEELQTARTHLAVVVDRLGRAIGIVTMEDILEEIVGELYDEREKEGDAERGEQP